MPDAPEIKSHPRPAKVKTNILTLTVRLHDPDEEHDPTVCASWITAKVPRSELDLGAEALLAKYVTPSLAQFPHFKK
jgi:hypothetical protein